MPSGLLKNLATLAKLTRISNLPTVWSNILLGFIAGWTCVGAALKIQIKNAPVLENLPETWQSGSQSLLALLVLLVAGSCFYLGGMALNDVCDARIDAARRSKRPIPSGAISLSQAAIIAALLLFAGLLGIAVMPRAFFSLNLLGHTLGLVGSILLYNTLHKRTDTLSQILSLISMGACRSLLILMATSCWASPYDFSNSTPLPLVLACIVGLYTASITWIARSEDEASDGAQTQAPVHIWPRKQRLVSLFTACGIPVAIFAAALSFLRAYDLPYTTLLFAALTAGCCVMLAAPLRAADPSDRLARPKSIMAWLAGLCLLDALALAMLGQPAWALVTIACFLLTKTAHRIIMGS